MALAVLDMSKSDITPNPAHYGVPFTPEAINYVDTDLAKLLYQVDVDSVRYIQELGEWTYPDVFSPFWRLYYNSVSGKSIFCEDQEYPLVPESLLLVPPHVFFSCTSTKRTDHLWIHFTLPAYWRADYEIPQRVELNPSLETIISQLKELADAPDAPNRKRAYAMANALVFTAISGLAPPKSSTMPALLQSILLEIDMSHGQVEKLSTLASRFNTSERNIRRLFVNSLGISPSSYILGTRMRHASRLLRNAELSIDQVAEQTGFADRFHFSKSFRKQIGQTPVEYRKAVSGVMIT